MTVQAQDNQQIEDRYHKAVDFLRDYLNGVVHTIERRDLEYLYLYFHNGFRNNITCREMNISPALGTLIRKKPAIKQIIEDYTTAVTLGLGETMARLGVMAESDITDVLEKDANGRYRVNLEMAKERGVSMTIRKYSSSSRTYTDKHGDEVVEFNEDVELVDPLKPMDMVNKLTGRYQQKRANVGDESAILDFLGEHAPDLLPLIFEKQKSPAEVLIKLVLERGLPGGTE